MARHIAFGAEPLGHVIQVEFCLQVRHPGGEAAAAEVAAATVAGRLTRTSGAPTQLLSGLHAAPRQAGARRLRRPAMRLHCLAVGEALLVMRLRCRRRRATSRLLQLPRQWR